MNNPSVEKKALGDNVTDPCKYCNNKIGCEDIDCHDSKDKPSFVSDIDTILGSGRR